MKPQRTQRYTENEFSKIILNSSLKIHKILGPGLLESACQNCLAYELAKQELFIESEKELPLV